VIILLLIIGGIFVKEIWFNSNTTDVTATHDLTSDKNDNGTDNLEENKNTQDQGIEVLSQNYTSFSQEFNVNATKVIIKTYIIKKGDTIADISKENHNSKTILMYNNPKIKFTNLKIGEKIKIYSPNGILYRIKKGDTLYWISKKFGILYNTIRESNDFRGSKLKKDDKIFLPIAENNIRGQNYIKRLSTSKHYSKKKKKYQFFAAPRWPVVWRGISSKFGMRYHPVLKRYILHKGVDLRASMNTRVSAFYPGKVVYAGWMNGYGRLIMIRHSKVYSTRYAHLNRIYVKVGQYVKQGQFIAKSGKTGRVTGPHLHFEIIKYGTPIDPMRFFRISTRSTRK